MGDLLLSVPYKSQLLDWFPSGTAIALALPGRNSGHGEIEKTSEVKSEINQSPPNHRNNRSKLRERAYGDRNPDSHNYSLSADVSCRATNDRWQTIASLR